MAQYYVRNAGGTPVLVDIAAGGGGVHLANGDWITGRNAADNANLNMFRVNSANFTEWQNPLYYDDGGAFINRNAVLHIERNIAAPIGVQPNFWSLAQGKGDNATQLGVSGGYFQARDRVDVTSSNKGVLYALQASVAPIENRNNFPFDDVVGLVVSNDGSARATEGVYIGHNVSGGGNDFMAGIGVECHSLDAAIYISGSHAYGLDFARGPGATLSSAAIRLKNAHHIDGRNAANSADIEALRVASDNSVWLAGGKLSVLSSGKITLGDADFSVDLGVTIANFAAIFFDANDAILYDRPANQMRFLIGGADRMQLSASAAGQTWLHVFDHDNNTLERVTVAPGNALPGAGVKFLVIPA